MQRTPFLRRQMNASGRQRDQGKVPCKNELCKEMKDCVNMATDPSQSAALQLGTNGRELDSTYRQCRGVEIILFPAHEDLSVQTGS